MASISVIIPTFNEAETIERLITHLLSFQGPTLEILVIDGESTDHTMDIASTAGAEVYLAPEKGRALQMNFGASRAKGEILYFVHADCLPPHSFMKDINDAVDNGFDLGRYRTKFMSSKWLLKINEFFTRFDWFICYGGDQTMFIKKDLFEASGGFDEGMQIMEDYDFVERARKLGRYKIMEGDVLVSARKYDNNSWLEVLKANSTIVKMYRKKASQAKMVDAYKQLLRN